MSGVARYGLPACIVCRPAQIRNAALVPNGWVAAGKRGGLAD
jgi:hypothetical protein